MPVFVIGKNELVTSTKAFYTGTNLIAMAPLLGIVNPDPFMGISVHNDDVARVHVAALDPRIPGGSNFMCSSDGIQGCKWNDAIEVVKKNFPDAVAHGIFPLGGDQPTWTLKVDSSKTEEMFGFKFANYEEQVKSVAGHYVELAVKEARMAADGARDAIPA